jgi:profilin
MSWDQYVSNLTGSGSVAKAAICGLDSSVWAQSAGFNIKPDEVKKLVDGCKKADNLREHGILVGGAKYFFLQSDDTQIQGKKGSAGLSVAKAGKCLVIGTYAEGQQPGNCRMQVERIRDYLVGAGY